MMKRADFSIGKIFRCGDKRWRCTDVGARVIVAICLDHDDDPSWYNGPPYPVAESVFDEYDIEGCALDADEEPRRRIPTKQKKRPTRRRMIWSNSGGRRNPR